MHLLDQLQKPVIFAHRGASASAPENTLAAFKMAVKQGAKAIELDTMLSRDGIPVVIHDHSLERTTNGEGFVSDFNAAYLQQLDAGSYFSETFKNERIPLLCEVLEKFSKDILINIELKNYHAPHDQLTEKVINMVDEKNLWNSILFSSFLPRNLKLIREKRPQAKVALLCPSGVQGWFFRSSLFIKLSPEVIHPFNNDVDFKFIEQEHLRNRRVHVWTVNDKSRAKELFSNDVDGIFTDDPITMLEVLRLLNPR